jgi:MYXO-CTERM domain-containing protein
MKRVALALAALVMLGASERFAVGSVTITYGGLADNAGPSATVLYGSSGYDLYGTSPVGTHTDADGDGPFANGSRITRLPAYVTSITSNGVNRSAAGWYDYYATIENPLGGMLQAGFTYNRSSTVSERNLLDLTVGENAPASFYVGVLTDTSSVERDCIDLIRLRQTKGGNGDSGLIAATGSHMTRGVDVYFFRIDGASSGDIITISGIETTQSPSGLYNDINLSGVLFADATVPEPSSVVVWLGMGAVGLIAAWRRRKRAA